VSTAKVFKDGYLRGICPIMLGNNVFYDCKTNLEIKTPIKKISQVNDSQMWNIFKHTFFSAPERLTGKLSKIIFFPQLGHKHIIKGIQARATRTCAPVHYLTAIKGKYVGAPNIRWAVNISIQNITARR